MALDCSSVPKKGLAYLQEFCRQSALASFKAEMGVFKSEPRQYLARQNNATLRRETESRFLSSRPIRTTLLWSEGPLDEKKTWRFLRALPSSLPADLLLQQIMSFHNGPAYEVTFVATFQHVFLVARLAQTRAFQLHYTQQCSVVRCYAFVSVTT
jgi:hypothetical protein